MSESACLFIMDDWPLTPDAPGGAGPLCYSHLNLLLNAPYNVVLIVLQDERAPKGFLQFTRTQPEVWQSIQAACKEHHIIPLSGRRRANHPLHHFVTALRDPGSFYFDPAVRTMTLLQNLITAVEPDVIWAEHLLPTTVASQLTTDVPIVYSHHDWHWRIKRHRDQKNRWRTRVKLWNRKRYEVSLVRRVAGCITASVSELAEIRQLGVERIAYFPTTYTPISFHECYGPAGSPRIVHLGGMQTTANRLGLERFLDVSWPIICQTSSVHPELWVVGSLAGASGSLLAKLKQAKAACPGFVDDLTTVLRPFDIHIIPWEHNTGTRTRIPLVLNYGQVLVSTKAGAACLPELRHNENCVLVQNLEQMAKEVTLLIPDESRRQKLARAGRDTFEKQYTREAVQPRFNQFLGELGF